MRQLVSNSYNMQGNRVKVYTAHVSTLCSFKPRLCAHILHHIRSLFHSDCLLAMITIAARKQPGVPYHSSTVWLLVRKVPSASSWYHAFVLPQIDGRVIQFNLRGSREALPAILIS